MFIKQDSLYNFALINTVLWIGGSIDYMMLNKLWILLGLVCCKNIFLVWLVAFKNVSKPYINPGIRRISVKEELGYLAQITLIDFISLRLLLSQAYPFQSIGWELVTFIPRSFAFELFFDFGHYTTHRFIHSIPWMYRNIHKEHHQYILITPLTTFHQDPIDLLLTNILPLLFASWIIPTSSLFVCVMMWYKTLLEVGGHLGKVTKANSFPQCIWLPRSLGIELKSEEHNLHHRNPMRNFSKRFSIWDKAFGTFEAYSLPSEE